MTLIKFWIISVRNRSLMYGREFPVNRARAKKMALPNQQLPITNSEKDEQFLAGVCDALGIELPRRSGSMELVEDDTGLESTSMPVFDFSTSNQLPAVSVRFNVNCVVWPVLIIESGGLYFCGLPLISNNSNRLIDHLSISAAFTTLQTLIGWYARDNVSTRKN